MEQQWRIYAPEGKDISFDNKMNLRNSSKLEMIYIKCMLKMRK